MKDERFAVLTLLAACATVAVVAIHHGLGMQQTAGWVGLAAVVNGTLAYSIHSRAKR